MARVDQNIRNPLADVYFNSIYRNAAKYALPSINDVCLDFGCGIKRLKPFLKKGKYIGFDANKEYSDVPDFRATKPTIFLALNVFEHLDDAQIEEVCKWLEKVKPRKIIMSMPTEYAINRFLCFLFARDFVHGFEHVNHWKNIARILDRHFSLVRYKRIFMMQWLSEWRCRQ